MVDLGDLPGGANWSIAYDVSADGSVVVGQSDSGPFPTHEAFVWNSADGMIGLGDFPGDRFISVALAVSGDGRIVVGAGDSTTWEIDGDTAFVWDSTNGMRKLQDVLTDDYGLDLAGWTLHRATDIAADGGTIVGWGTNPSGQWEAWIAVPPPKCGDTFDNDGDGLVDFPEDPGCLDRDRDVENPQCQDGINNDPGQDSLIDFDGGLSAGIASEQETAPDPQCVGKPWKGREGTGCGLGFELTPALLPFLWRRVRRRGASVPEKSGTLSHACARRNRQAQCSGESPNA